MLVLFWEGGGGSYRIKSIKINNVLSGFEPKMDSLDLFQTNNGNECVCFVVLSYCELKYNLNGIL